MAIISQFFFVLDYTCNNGKECREILELGENRDYSLESVKKAVIDNQSFSATKIDDADSDLIPDVAAQILDAVSYLW